MSAAFYNWGWIPGIRLKIQRGAQLTHLWGSINLFTERSEVYKYSQHTTHLVVPLFGDACVVSATSAALPIWITWSVCDAMRPIQLSRENVRHRAPQCSTRLQD
ncbi:hypothetical protein RRG08_046188 [Elysia crispata]|uniref:Uncharacterized protein n=1 Tax=Elysia crispata TaxID=231223 RepID=A0AAE0XNA7_9GAST|nr:hypothetical protein RRG08_046188 [Elysia crispata]